MNPDAPHTDDIVHDNDFSRVIVRHYRDNSGALSTWTFISPKNFGKSAFIAALTADGMLVLERSYRIPIGDTVIELPCGRNDIEGESAEQVAKRELLEETGYGKGTYSMLCEFPELPGLTDQEGVLFFAKDVEKIAEPSLGDSEKIETFLLPFQSAMRTLLESGEKVDLKVYAAISLIRETKNSLDDGRANG